MEKALFVLFLVLLLRFLQTEEKIMNIYDFSLENISGEMINLSDYEGKVIMVVNTTRKCGFTYQYEGLENLYKKYKDQGLVILGFPSNDFLKQEPGTNSEIAQFCKIDYGVTFPMFSKISVKGKKIHPLYSFLTSKKSDHDFGGKISWNFNKFLISKDGRIIARFVSKVKLENKRIIKEIEEALK